MKKRTVLVLLVLAVGALLGPTWIHRHPGDVKHLGTLAVPLVVAAQAAPLAGDLDAPSYQADPLAAERAKARSRFHYLMLGYGAIWLCLGIFLVDLARKVGRVGTEIEELEARLEATEHGKRI